MTLRELIVTLERFPEVVKDKDLFFIKVNGDEKMICWWNYNDTTIGIAGGEGAEVRTVKVKDD